MYFQLIIQNEIRKYKIIKSKKNKSLFIANVFTMNL